MSCDGIDRGRTKANDLGDRAGPVRTDMVRVAVSRVGITTDKIMAGDDVTRRTCPAPKTESTSFTATGMSSFTSTWKWPRAVSPSEVRSGEIKRQHDVVFVVAGRMIERVLQNEAEGTRIVVRQGNLKHGARRACAVLRSTRQNRVIG